MKASDMLDCAGYKTGGALSTKERDRLPSADFVFPRSRSYPINDANHARNALARVSQHGSPEEKARVRTKVRSKYPSIEQSNG